MEPLKTASRYGKASLIAAIITFAIFFFMQMLVAEKNVIALEKNPGRTIDWVPAEPRKPPEVFKPTERPDEVKPPPPLDPVTKKPPIGNTGSGVIFDPILPPKEKEISLDNDTVWARVQPTPAYPIRARLDGVEGYVLLEFTVDEKGKVVGITVLDESPKGYGFARSAVRAAENFKYQARTVDGKAVATPGVREKFEYSLEDDR